ncbi:spermidine synthase [Desulfobacula sp.]|uniref:spermine/spermidine synthase domain-containing protein n=1 Tax=Desulfobacula sp. TaxID=2593537 RepID=UPI002608FF92|nr:spermidine synthase [Desulfobacula sp.]
MNYEELDFQKTPIGDLMLRRRRLIQLKGLEIYEIKLGEAFLMTSLFHEAEHMLSKLGLAKLEKENLEIVIGGLGLGYTAVSALEDPRIASLTVIEYLQAVIDWHEKSMVPLGPELMNDPRCQLVQGDFFALARDLARGFDPMIPGKKYDAVLLDIDHTPTNVLYQTNTRFYTETGLTELTGHLKPGGVFALWADGFPEDEITSRLEKVFGQATSHTIEFKNPLTGGTSEGAVYVAQVVK